MKLVIEIDDVRYKDIQRIASVQLENYHFKTAEQIIANGTPLPSVEPERKTAHWIPVYDSTGKLIEFWRCSACNGADEYGSHFCSDCGAKMEEQDGE